MRGMTILLAIALTLGYGFAAQAAMTADRAETIRRLAGSPDVSVPNAEQAATRVWYGGMLPAVTVEVTKAPPPATGKCRLT
jgi:hypothetical protein